MRAMTSQLHCDYAWASGDTCLWVTLPTQQGNEEGIKNSESALSGFCFMCVLRCSQQVLAERVFTKKPLLSLLPPSSPIVVLLPLRWRVTS
jgi:hypothetical protein